MSAAGGTPVGVEERVELGLRLVCGNRVCGRFLRDLTAFVAEVEHCLPLDVPRESS
ncbi:hypothetical protein [Kitasatospora sp. NPDC094016]|uniref:hypothetical protein n=1 Tax=Kitasatospora sp. NPDC094016 TaxID=3154986 RepID=UPI003325F99F